MSHRRVKIDINDDDDNKISIALEGQLTRDKILQILDFIDFLGGPKQNSIKQDNSLSKFAEVQNILEKKFSLGWFSSQEVMVVYEDVFSKPIGPSTISTYLSRLVDKGILMRSGTSTKRKYKMVKNILSKNSDTQFKIQP